MKHKYFRDIVAAILLLFLTGCGTRQASEPKDNSSAAQNNGSAAQNNGEKVVHEAWYAVYMRGSKMGYSHTKTVQETENEQTVFRTDEVTQLEMPKGKDRLKVTITTSTTSTPEGKLLHYQYQQSLGALPMISKGTVVDNNRLVVHRTIAGKTREQSAQLPGDLVADDAWRRSLMEKPMTPGEKRTFHFLNLMSGKPLTQEVVAIDYEQTELLNTTRKLLRLDHVITTEAGDEMQGSVWIDPNGRILKTKEQIGIESYLTTQQVAMAPGDGGQFNLFSGTIIKIPRPLPQGIKTPQARYRVILKDADPSEILATSAAQRVSGHATKIVATVIVRTIDPTTPIGGPFIKEKGPTAADRDTNAMIQSDDALVIAMAGEVAQGERDPWTIAKALEQHIHRSMKETNFKQAFATAAEVAKSRSGDCSEYAVLLTAVCRARKIPARVAMGLVYMPSAQAFGYHMWTEVWIADRWIGLDATLKEGGVAAGHIKIADTPLSNGLSDSAFIKVAQFLAAEPRIELIKTD